MKHLRAALAGILALFAASAAVAQTFPTVPDRTVIGRLGSGSSAGPAQAIPFATLAAQIGSSGGGAALTRVDDTNVTLTLGGSPATALVNAASITAGWSGVLSLARGGTGSNLTASTGGIVYSGGSGLAILSGTASAGQMLRSGASAAPTWSTSVWPATTTANQLLYSSSTNTVTGLASANNGVLATDASGIPSISTSIGLNAATSGTAGTITATNTQNANTAWTLTNASTGTAAQANLNIANSNGSMSFGIGGANLSSSGGILANRGFMISAQALSGMLIGAGSTGGVINPIIFALNSTDNYARLGDTPGKLTLGLAGTRSTPLCFENATSGSECIQVAAGALGSGVATLLAGTYDLVGTSLTQALTGKTINGNTFTSGTYTLTGAASKTLTFNNTITLAGTDSTTMTFPTTTATIARTDAAQTFTGIQTFAGGSAATPGVTIGNAGVGLHSTAANNLAFDVSGVVLMDYNITTSSKFTFSAGMVGLSSILSNFATGGIGYTTGAGGAITQGAGRTTGVTLSKVTGTITTDTASLAAEAAAEFTVTNTAVAITDTINLSIQSGSNGGNTAVNVTGVAAGSFKIKVSNNNPAAGTAETGAILINFTVIKGVTSFLLNRDLDPANDNEPAFLTEKTA